VRTLITGGCGFVGANLVPMLLERGCELRILDNFSLAGPDRVARSGVEVIEGDVRDAAAVARAAEGIDAVIHLAAFGSVADSIADPLENFDVNARGTLVALEAAARAGARRFVFASTGGALIGDAPAPVDESSLPRPISPYGASKLCGEGYCHAFRGSYSLETGAHR
jgi:UDP-glucose 4-epimerase